MCVCVCVCLENLVSEDVFFFPNTTNVARKFLLQ